VDNIYPGRKTATEVTMFTFVTSLFGCTHARCTFPMTATKMGPRRSGQLAPAKTYVVCLDCGKEFPYDWERMKVVTSGKSVHQDAA
jgi:hypothetical protein